MKVAILNFAHRLKDQDFSELFALYPASDFEQEVANHDATKAESDRSRCTSTLVSHGADGAEFGHMDLAEVVERKQELERQNC